jgi:outer membrane protein OmpA-like peptidoglycan-associated protein
MLAAGAQAGAPSKKQIVMEPRMNRGIWLILAAVVLVAIGLSVRPLVTQTPEAPPAAQTPPTAPPAQSVTKEAAAPLSAAQPGEQKPAASPAPAPTPQAGEKAQPPSPGASAGSAEAEKKETAAPAPPHPPTVETAGKEAPASSETRAPGSAEEATGKETTPAPSQSAAPPAAPTGEKEQGTKTEEAASHANDKAKGELTSLQPGFAPKDLVAALNDSVINFPSDSAEVPGSVTEFLHKAADDLKQLPAGHVVEIAGYTDNTGDAALNVALSQKRADAVRQTLIKFGADPNMLIAKGYGSANPIASNDTPEGRLRNRRIEYHIVKTPT